MATGLNLPFSNTPPAPKVFAMGAWMPDATPAATKPLTGNERSIQAEYATEANLASFVVAPEDIDGWATGANGVVLVKTQSAPAENGLYQIHPTTFALERHPDYATAADYERGVIVGVTRGDLFGGKAFKLTAPAPPIELGTTALAFVETDPTAVAAAGASL